MRPTVLALALVLSSTPAFAHPTAKAVTAQAPAAPKAETPRTLEPGEVSDRLRVVEAELGACYLGTVGELRGAGRLELRLDIHRTGAIDAIDVATPGLPERLWKKIDTCVRAAIGDLAFPARRAPTVAVVPYFYQRTAATHGPQLSCWNPKGCPAR